MLASLERGLVERGYMLDALLVACQRIGGERAAMDFGLSEAEKARLYMALQLQALQALETIRSQSQMAGLDQLSENEINAETQAVREEAANSHRP